MIGRGQRIDKAAAHRLHVEGRAVSCAERGSQLGLQNTRGAGKHHVRRGGGDDDQTQISGRNARGFERAAAGVQRQIAGEFVICRDVPLTDAGAAEYPFVGGFDRAFEVLVAQHLGR